ncbi:phospholipid carrier-dependent glycosyltransferase [Patescibacteria group bacterium]|nr:phospholipid carrier-dependent glycosyltransferase [Patescibacteria group bacterium]
MQKLSLYLQRGIVALIILTAAALMINAARGDSAIFDETAHIVSGYDYVHNLDARFNPEHPPLVKMLAALPLEFQNISFTAGGDYWTGTNQEWTAGKALLYGSGNDANRIIFSARLAPILITLLLILMTYLLALEVVGRWWALLPTFLAGFSPMILANGHYVTTDTGAAFGILLALFYFIRFTLTRNRTNLITTGLAFGIAQSIKFSALILIPFFLLALAAFLIVPLIREWPSLSPQRKQRRLWRSLTTYVISLAGIFVIGYAGIIYPLYRAATWNYPAEKQIADTGLLLQSSSHRITADLTIWAAGNPVLRPFADYSLGVLMDIQREDQGNTAFFLGQLSNRGWHDYFPIVYSMKESLPALILVLLGLFLGCWHIADRARGTMREILSRIGEFIEVQFAEFCMILFIVLYWAFSISSPLNIGIRHILPTVPLFYILATGAVKKWFAAEPKLIPHTRMEKASNASHAFFGTGGKIALIAGIVLWAATETLSASPYFLSYFNELFGGTTGGYAYVADSNFDWGQDLLRLRLWTDANLSPSDKIAVDYFGGGDPHYTLGDQAVPWTSADGDPSAEGIHWLAVSANTLQEAKAALTADASRNPTDEYIWLSDPYHPYAKAGTSIFIYKLP